MRWLAGARLGLAIALLASLLGPRPDVGAAQLERDAPVQPELLLPAELPPPSPPSVADAQQGLQDQATLETRRPEVQYTPGGSSSWMYVADRQLVQAGDRVRTGAGAAARLVYFEGTMTDIGPNTGLVVQRVERTPNGGLVGTLFQSLGTTISRVTLLVDPAGSFEIETPAATAFVRGTTPRVVVAPDGVTRVGNLPDGTDGLVGVRGRDPLATVVMLRPGEETRIAPGQAPAQPGPLGTYGALAGAPAGGWEGAQSLQQQRQQQQAQRQALAQQQVAQAQAGLAATTADLERFSRQERALVEELLTQLGNPSGTTSGGMTATSAGQVAGGLALTGSGPCATAPGSACTVGSDLAGSSGTVTSSMRWQIVVAAGRVPAGATANVFLPTTLGRVEFFGCAAAVAFAPTACSGTTAGNGLQGGLVQVFVGGLLVARGTLSGPGPSTPTPVATPTAALPTASMTATGTPTVSTSSSPTATPSPTASAVTLTRTPTAPATRTATPTLTLTAPATATATRTATATPTASPTSSRL